MRPTALPDSLTLNVPLRLTRRGGRKEMVLPEGAPAPHCRIDNTMVKALARAFRWKRLLESAAFSTIAELAEHERIAPSYLTRVMKLTLLAPDIIETLLKGELPNHVTLNDLLDPLPADWMLQRTEILRTERKGSVVARTKKMQVNHAHPDSRIPQHP